jgi:hypothetical protein
MKIRIKKRDKEKQDVPVRSILDKRIKLPNNIRLGAIGIIFLFLVYFVFKTGGEDIFIKLITGFLGIFLGIWLYSIFPTYSKMFAVIFIVFSCYIMIYKK